MRRKTTLSISLLWVIIALVVGGCADMPADLSGEADSPRWPHAVSYEVFVHAFADSKGNGIGDLPGLTAKLDYVQNLGVKALWLMPIHPSPSYHKYDVTDYRAIHPDYGTMEEFDTFLREAHARDIRVVIDLVINHTARSHPWFQAAVADTTSPYFHFYIWAHPDRIEQMTVDVTGPDTDNIRRWNPVDEFDSYFYAYFWSGMPDLNYDNPAVRDSIYEIGRFWLEKGVDGFRLDAARHLFPEGREEDIYAFWDEFRAEMEAVNPDVLLLGEVWAPTEEVAPYLTGLPSLFNFEMAGAMMEAALTGRGAGLAERHAVIRAAYAEVADDFVDATFLTNHDQNRVMSVLDDENKARVAASLLFTLPGAPYVYYGEEIGMRGMKPDPHIREPFLWAEQPDELRTAWIEPRYSTDDTVVPMEVQARTDTSLLNHYKTLIALRNDQPALTFGGLEPLDAPDERLSVFLRGHTGDTLLVVHNVGGEPVRWERTGRLLPFEDVVYQSHERIAISESAISLPPHSMLVLRR